MITTFYDFINLIPITESNGDESSWSEPLVGSKVSKHLSKNQVRGLLSDEDYSSVVKHHNHIPVFRVKIGKKLVSDKDGVKEVKVGNTGGTHHIHYKISNQGKILKKTVFRKESGLHPKMDWAIQSKWDINGEK